MSEWTPKVGDRVRIVGHPTISGQGVIRCAGTDNNDYGWYVVAVDRPVGYFADQVHIRNLDLILEDERRGLPRPPIQEGEDVEVRLVERAMPCTERELGVHVEGCLSVNDRAGRVRQIERRVQNLGRQARKE